MLWRGLPDLTADGDKKQTLCGKLPCCGLQQLSWPVVNWLPFHHDLFLMVFFSSPKSSDMSKNFSGFQVCSSIPPWYKVQCFGLGNPSLVQQVSLKLRPRKTLCFLQIHRHSFGDTGLEVRDLKDPHSLKRSQSFTVCSVMAEHVWTCLGFLHSLQGAPQRSWAWGTSQEARSSAGRCDWCWSDVLGASLACKVQISSDDRHICKHPGRLQGCSGALKWKRQIKWSGFFR